MKIMKMRGAAKGEQLTWRVTTQPGHEQATLRARSARGEQVAEKGAGGSSRCLALMTLPAYSTDSFENVSLPLFSAEH